MAVILSYEDYQQWFQRMGSEEYAAPEAFNQPSLERIGQLLQSVLVDADWEDVEAGRADRWF